MTKIKLKRMEIYFLKVKKLPQGERYRFDRYRV